MKKVLIIARPEGASDLLWANSINLEKGFKSLAADINQAAKAAFDFGAEVMTFTPVASYHIYNWLHLPYLDKRIKSVSEKEIYDNIADISAVVLIGMTAKAGTMNAFMDGTYNGVAWHDYFLNGVLCGEIGIYKAYFSHFGVPIVFASGDIAACKEAEEEINGIKTVAVKKAICRNRAEKILGATDKFYSVLIDALKNPPAVSDKIQLPAVVRITLNRTEFCDDCLRWFSFLKRIDARTLEKHIENIKTIYDLIV